MRHAATAQWEVELAAVPVNVPEIRAGVSDFAAGNGAGDALVGDIALAVTEAVTNAVIHAFIDLPTGTIRAIAQTGDGVIVVQVIDDGRGMMPRADSPGLGLGLPMMGQLTSSCDIREGADGRGTEVRMTFAAPGVRGPAEAAPPDARLRVLEEVSRVVDEGGWPGEGVERLIDLLVPDVADAGTIDLVDPNGRPYRLGARVAGDRGAELSEWLGGRVPRQDQIEAALVALRAGDWHLIPIDRQAVARLAHDDEDARGMAGIEVAWWLNLPLGSGERLLGSLGLGFSGERGNPEDERPFLEALAERVTRSLANTELIARLRRTRRRLERILDALTEAVVVRDEHGRVVYANAAADELLAGRHVVTRSLPLEEGGSLTVEIIGAATP